LSTQSLVLSANKKVKTQMKS